MVVLHEELKHAAAGMAAEAVKNTLLFVDRERRGLLAVERTKPHVIAAGFLERDIIGDHFDDRCAIANLSDFFLANHGTKLDRLPLTGRRGAGIIPGEHSLFAGFDQALAQLGQWRHQVGMFKGVTSRSREQ